jgi:DNA-binding response OmpR family regulator
MSAKRHKGLRRLVGIVCEMRYRDGALMCIKEAKRTQGGNMPSLGMRPEVLIVDDEKLIGESLAAIFTSRGYESQSAFSAEQAVEIIARWEPDLATLDVELPKMNGIDLAIALENEHPACRVLLFSGQPNTADLLAQAEADGHVFDIVAKPAHPTVMLDRAAHLLSTTSPEALKTPEELD